MNDGNFEVAEENVVMDDESLCSTPGYLALSMSGWWRRRLLPLREWTGGLLCIRPKSKLFREVQGQKRDVRASGSGIGSDNRYKKIEKMYTGRSHR